MQKFIKKILLYGLFAVVILNLIATICSYSLKHSNFYKPSFASQVAAKGTFDYIILGSSMGLTTLDTKLIDSVTGFNGINLSMDDTGLSTHFLMLEHFLKQGGKTKNVLLTISPWEISSDEYKIGDNDYRFLPFIQNNYISEHFSKLKKEIIHPITTSKYFPLYGLGYYNSEIFYPSLISLLKPKYKNRFDERGNYVYPTIQFNSSEFSSSTYNFEIKNKYLFKVEDLCIKNNINLFIYQSPIYKANYKSFINQKNVINHINLLNSNPEMFYDRIHVNAKGRKYATLNIIKEIRSFGK